MERDEEIQKIGERIQKQINRLCELNCSIDSAHNTIGIFDDNIEPEMHEEFKNKAVSHMNQVVYDFDLSGKRKKKIN